MEKPVYSFLGVMMICSGGDMTGYLCTLDGPRMSDAIYNEYQVSQLIQMKMRKNRLDKTFYISV